MKLTPLNADTIETSSPRYPTRRGWRQRQARWVRGALAAAGATAVLWSGGCRTAGEPPPANIDQTRTAGVPQTVDPPESIKPPEEPQPVATKPPEAEVPDDVGRTAGVPQQPAPPPQPTPPQPTPPVAPAPPVPAPPSTRLSGAVARPAYPVTQQKR